jgi:hypothetical protein
MMQAMKASMGHGNAALYTVRLRPGEGLWEARERWQATTGRRGLVLIR